ncbi:fluoride efflux transporter CrcB [Flavobacteriaceae bacterium F08102]|nr:fluoride efflux transporter CrcB [Flavobacteriaceae bacterium F08102]
MKQLLMVFIGGGLGSVARYLVTKYFNVAKESIAYGTLTVNVLGSFLIGVILGYVLKSNGLTQNQTLLLATGFCGGFTTFSAFAYENMVFLKAGDYVYFFSYTLATFALGLAAVFLGLWLVK